MIPYTPSWRNTVDDDLALRKTYSDKLAIIYQMIAKCGNSALGCNKKTGKSINNWRDDRDRYNKLIASLDAKIKIESATLTVASKAKAEEAIAAQKKALAAQESGKADLINADISTKNTTKYILIGTAVVAVLVGGFVMYKKFRKGK